MTDDTVTVEVEVSSEEVAREVVYGILTRAADLHEDPNPDNEDVAIELRDVGQDLLENYE